MNYRASLLFLLLIAPVGVAAQSSAWWCGTSDPAPKHDCGVYQWPEVSVACPDVQIKQKHDHTPNIRYRDEGWDTAVTCVKPSIELSVMPYIPSQYFNGQYYVDTIPYDPPDTTFYFGTQLPNDDDDKFCAPVNIPYPFYFFGFKKNSFSAGGNGIITFTSGITGGTYCEYGDYDPMPWTSSTTSKPSVSVHRDAIYGVFQDTDPSGDMSGKQGIWYGIMDQYPCRKIIASYNELPWFPHASNTDNRQSYQIVCYEGSNIIEVHVKRRRRGNTSCSWCNYGLIGIQNATGQNQVAGADGTPTEGVVSGAPPAFWPVGRNAMKNAEQIDSMAYRFTPAGPTSYRYEWYRIFDNGDTVHLTTDINDTNGYFIPIDESSECPSLTRATLTPTRTSRYGFALLFQNANHDWYELADTIVIGMDTAKTTILRARSMPSSKKTYNICEGDTAKLYLEMLALQNPVKTEWLAQRIVNGTRITLPIDSVLTFGFASTQNDTTRRPIVVNPDLPTTGKLANKIDSIYLQVSIDYASGCFNYDSILLCSYPNFDTTETYTLCRGEKLTWTANGQTYGESTKLTENLKSAPGCDSIVHLDLTVLDVTYSTDHIVDCKPVTWINGVTYETSNTATRSQDTVHRVNIYGCDSIVTLDLTIVPLEARIQSSRTFFDYSNLDVVLSDISSGGDTRTWVFPGGGSSTSSVAYYTMPADLDEADILLIEQSRYGCIDSANILIPMRRENMWLPNAFMPDNPAGNNLFGSVSQKTLTQEMYIYNRNGELVFSCDTPDCTWDGRDANGNPCAQGTYVYMIRYTNQFEPMRTQVLRGTVTLIR